MAKQLIISAMEEVLGEYILNMSKENMKIAVLRGHIKLENVQLDGDLIGSHVLGTIGLSSFGVLSCSAKSLKASVPWKNLVKEPTRFEIKGVHLVCVPLTQSTANQMYGSGSVVDPRCTLRTRAKRLVLARYERNFWNGQIVGEGPVMKRIQRAVKEVQRDLKRGGGRKKNTQDPDAAEIEDSEVEKVLNKVVSQLGESVSGRFSESDGSSQISSDDLPDLPRDWKVRFREKVLRNIEAIIEDVHIRCEVPERGLEATNRSTPLKSPKRSGQKGALAGERAFTLGFTLESIIIRTANENWEEGSHEKRRKETSGAASSSEDHLGPNEYVVHNNKICYIKKLSVYWDDDPPMLLSNTDLIQGNYRKLSVAKLLSRIDVAMEALIQDQEPGKTIRQSLSATVPRNISLVRPHDYICEGLDTEMRIRQSDPMLPGPISCSADVLPFDFAFNILPNQYMQYKKLKAAIQAQQRFDTMLRQRPDVGPMENPRVWWKYAVACVTSRPNSRPWEDVKHIGKYRERYIELVAKKNSRQCDGVGYHAGLSSRESSELLSIEEALPIEALLAFHLVALRLVFVSQNGIDAPTSSDKSDVPMSTSPSKGKPSGRFRLLRNAANTNKKSLEAHFERHTRMSSAVESSRSSDSLDMPIFAGLSLLDAMTLRLGRKVWFVDWNFRDATLNVKLKYGRHDNQVLHFTLRSSGNARSLGRRKQNFSFAVNKCELEHGPNKVFFFGPDSNESFVKCDNVFNSLETPFSGQRSCGSTVHGGLELWHKAEKNSAFLKLPPSGTVFHVAAGRDKSESKLSLAAHPATLVWTTSLFDGLSEFFIDRASTSQLDLTQHIRNAATPLAQKAQLALLSPRSLSLHLNVSSPKLLVPLLTDKSEGTLLLDAGSLRTASLKDEGETEVHWDIQAHDIAVNFLRGAQVPPSDCRVAKPKRYVTSVVRPFSIDATSRIGGGDSFSPPQSKAVDENSRITEVLVSPVCLNLVNAETLARSFGKWYARGLHRFRHLATVNRNFKIDDEHPLTATAFSTSGHAINDTDSNMLRRKLCLQIEKIELAVEGHSKRLNVSDERSMISSDSVQESAPPTRAYLVEIAQIFLLHSCVDNTASTKLTVADASIVRLQDVALYIPLRCEHNDFDSQNCILLRARSINSPARDSKSPSTTNKQEKYSIDEQENPRTCILQASLLHNSVTQLNEVEVDIDSVVLRVTPTTLKDCAKAFKRIMELAQVITKEMERQVHEQGRRARRRVRDQDGSVIGSVAPSLLDRPVSPAFSDAMTTFTEYTVSDRNLPKSTLDSSILFRVTLKQSTLLAGRPTSMTKNDSAGHRHTSFAVIQILSNVLVMFQSIENPDATGNKTLHVSVDNISALVNTEFECVSLSESPPMIEPTGAEIRVVYSTENYGCVVSQDASIDCDCVKAGLTPDDLSILVNIARTMAERLRAFGTQSGGEERISMKKNALTSLIRYQKTGTGIATRIRVEVQTFSFVLLRVYRSHFGAPEFLDFNVRHVKGLFEGCMSALSGECSARVSVVFFNSEVNGWEDAVEAFPFTVQVEQMPDELILSVSPTCPVQLNLTGSLLQDLANMRYDIHRTRHSANPGETAFFSPSILSTVGLRRATEACSVTVVNLSGFHIHVTPESDNFDPDSGFVASDSRKRLESVHGDTNDGEFFLTLRLAESAAHDAGERIPVSGLPIKSLSRNKVVYLLKPVPGRLQPGQAKVLRLLDGRGSPESIISDGLIFDTVYYNAEPVVEWCMQNQRLDSLIADVFSMPKGSDLLCSQCWSPEYNAKEDSFDSITTELSPSPLDGPEMAAGAGSFPKSSSLKHVQNNILEKRCWVQPYLKNDAPEWTDMTCTIKIERDRILLPDSKWLWVNEWTVDLNGSLSEHTDADGWNYEAEFETFGKQKRHYERGDLCRRRRWTRTRLVRPPKLNDPLRPLKFVWETTKDENGCYVVTVRSHVRIRNTTSIPLSFFVYTPSWDSDKMVGTAVPGEHVNVPIFLASAVYLRIGKRRTANEPAALHNCVLTDRFSMIPMSHTSSSHTRIHLNLDDVSSTVLHFIVELRNETGILDITIEPTFRLINLLPCQLECRAGEIVCGKSEKRSLSTSVENAEVSKMETLSLQSGKGDSCLAVSPWRKPHISFRVPGYKWSVWKRIVNRKNDSTWRPSEKDEESYFTLKEESEYADELKMLVRFESLSRTGDPLILILSVACGHCPTIRVYAQYWIADKTGFGCRFSEGFTDLLGNIPDSETSRRSYLLKEESTDPHLSADMRLPGHQWSIGSSGMSLYFSHRERLALVIEKGIERISRKRTKTCKSKWISPLDVSNVIPKTVFSVDELNGPRRFELAIHVTLCPGLFARTKMISLLPRYQIVNLLHRELAITQDGCIAAESIIPSHSSVPFHWEKGSLPPKVRLGAPSNHERHSGNYERCWTNGRFQIDRIGITSLRLPTSNTLVKIPMVVQAEVRLATKDQASAIVVVIWSGNEKSNPLYTLRNRTNHTILCRQPLQDQENEMAGPDDAVPSVDSCTMTSGNTSVFECGAEIGPSIRAFLGLDQIDEFVWILKPGDVTCFGFDDPEKLHILEWRYVLDKKNQFDMDIKNAFLEVDAMGSTSALSLPGGPQVVCQIRAEHSTKVIEFVEFHSSDSSIIRTSFRPLEAVRQRGLHLQDSFESEKRGATGKITQNDEEETASFSLRIDFPQLSISVVDNIDPSTHGREIMLAQFENLFLSFSQTREGYHEFEVRLMAFQVDNHVRKSIHPILVFCPRVDKLEPLLHMSAVRRLQLNSSTFVFRYAAIRVLEIEIFLDRRTAETIARFIQPLMILREETNEDLPHWVNKLTSDMERSFAKTDLHTPRDLERMIHMANSGRIYFEQLHLHPVRLGLTFTQEWIDLNAGSDTVMVFQFLRGMASIAKAPLVFTSFVVGHVFESPQALVRVIATHYSSQLTKQVFGILGSLAILGAPADFISNVGTGVRDFFYEPIQGAVHGPRQFIEGLEAGTQSLARGLFVGVVRGAANVTDAVNGNLAGLTADEEFIDERKAHQRMLTDAMSRGSTCRTFNDSLNLAVASVSRGLKSGALGIVEQPTLYASKHGPVGFLKGVGKAIVGAVVKPVVGLGDGAVLVMNHMSDATSNERVFPKIPKRLRRALPSHASGKLNCVRLEPYDERAAKAQKIVTGGESVDDVYIGHINIASHLIIASEQCLWAIDRRSREPWCVNWKEISHFGVTDGGVRIVVFSQTGLKTYLFHIETRGLITKFNGLLSMQLDKMANVYEVGSTLLSAEPESLLRQQIAGVQVSQENHIFGSFNNSIITPAGNVRDEVDLVEQCRIRVHKMHSGSPTYLKSLDEEAWSLISCWGHLYSGLSSRRCIVAGLINGTGYPIQIKSAKLVEGGSACYALSTREHDSDQDILNAGGAIVFFGWGVVPNLLQAGNVFMNIETNAFVSDLADQRSSATFSHAMPGYQVGFLEKSYDVSGWWAKYWLLVRQRNNTSSDP